MKCWFSRMGMSLASLLIVWLLSGCASQNVVRQEHYFWPPPPDPPRIEWLNVYSSQLDIEQTPMQRFWASISGNDKPIPFIKPIEVKSIPELQKFYVSDVGRPAVVVYDLGRHEIRSLETPSSVPPIQHPISLAYDTRYNLYVLDRRSKSILVFDSSEKYQRSIDLARIAIDNPIAMALDRTKERFYIADGSGLKKIHAVDLQGQELFSFGSSGDEDGQFNLPVAITVNSRGEIIVGDAFAASVQIFSPEGEFKSKFGSRGDVAGNFQLIKSVAVDSEDNIYVVDGRSHNISIFNRQGELLLVLGGYYAVGSSGRLAPGGFSLPISIDIDSTDKLFVVDQMNVRVQVFQYISQSRRNSTTIK